MTHGPDPCSAGPDWPPLAILSEETVVGVVALVDERERNGCWSCFRLRVHLRNSAAIALDGSQGFLRSAVLDPDGDELDYAFGVDAVSTGS
ncbi:hypothetical protein ACVXZ4_06155 [Lacisediminihabitans sp. FW035]